MYLSHVPKLMGSRLSYSVISTTGYLFWNRKDVEMC